jgi:hypothetical protein
LPAAAAAGKDATLAEPERGKRTDEYASRALEQLGRAASAGYFKEPKKIQDLKDNPDLAGLRSRKEYQLWLAQVERAAPGK